MSEKTYTEQDIQNFLSDVLRPVSSVDGGCPTCVDSLVDCLNLILDKHSLPFHIEVSDGPVLKLMREGNVVATFDYWND